MPKSFSDTEKSYIKQRLMEETEACLSLYGIRKTTVDDLVKRVKIPKGTFYLFYPSKEALIFDVILRLNTTIQEKLLKQVTALQTKPDTGELTELIFSLYQSLNGSFLMKLIENGELELYIQKAPKDFIQQNVADDDLMVGKLLSLFPNMDKTQTALYSGALRAIFLMPLYRDKIACEQFDEMMKLIIRGVVQQMLGDKL